MPASARASPRAAPRRVSADGYELRFAVNYLAGFDLTLRLLPLLKASPAARVVNVGSIGQHPIDFDDVMLEHNYSGTRAYGQSKLAQITAGFVLAERLSPGAITVNSLHPATYMPTKMVLNEIGHSVDTLEQGEAATRRLITPRTSPPPPAGSSTAFTRAVLMPPPTTPRPAAAYGGSASTSLGRQTHRELLASRSWRAGSGASLLTPAA